MVEMQINYLLQQDTDEKRQKVWSAIRETLGTLGEDSPIRRGKGSSLSAEQQATVSHVATRIRSAFANIGEWELIQQVFIESTKKGQYATVEAYAEHMASKAENNMKRAIRENRFTGLMDGDSIFIQEPETPEEEE